MLRQGYQISNYLAVSQAVRSAKSSGLTIIISAGGTDKVRYWKQWLTWTCRSSSLLLLLLLFQEYLSLLYFLSVEIFSADRTKFCLSAFHISPLKSINVCLKTELLLIRSTWSQNYSDKPTRACTNSVYATLQYLHILFAVSSHDLKGSVRFCNHWCLKIAFGSSDYLIFYYFNLLKPKTYIMYHQL